MKEDESLKTIEKLERSFDDATVKSALASLENDGFDSWIISTLLEGRGATLRWPTIERQLNQHLSLKNVARLAGYLPRSEVTALLAEAHVDDSQIIEQIKDGQFPPIRILPQEHRERIYDEIRKKVKADSSSDHAATLILFLLNFDKHSALDRFPNERSIELAREWCLNFRDEETVDEVLSRLLWYRPSKELVQLAETRLYESTWTSKTTFLLTGLMDATRGFQKTDWIDRWYEFSEPNELDDWVISEWLRTTNCSRRALSGAKKSIREGYGSLMVLLEMMEFLHRKTVHRWIDRFIETYIDHRLVRTIIRDLVRRSPTKRHCVLAKQAMKASHDEKSDAILLELVSRTCDSEVIELAKQRVREFPNAPQSFELMCGIAKTDAKVAVPWIKEWIGTALPDQVTTGLTAVIKASSTNEHLQMARVWLLKVTQGELPVSTWKQADLLDAFLRLEPRDNAMRIAADVLLKSADKTHPVMRRLARRLG